jgi:hypothetical protein
MVRCILPVVVVGLLGVSDAGTSNNHTLITVWASAPATAFGGTGYGGPAPPTGAMITERRELDVAGSGEVRIAGVASTIDPGSVQLRDLTDPSGVTITEQRFVPGATSPDEILARHVGDTITVVTPRGEVNGVLRSVDATTLVLEIGTGDQRHLQAMRRDSYVQDVRLPASGSVDKPSLVWRLSTKKPGKHAVELTYRAEGMSWTADYLAILDEAAKTLDFSAWATVKNQTGAAFDGAELTLASGGGTSSGVANPLGAASPHSVASPVRFVVPSPVHLGAGEAVQVELVPTRTAAKARSIVTYEPEPDASSQYQGYPATDCNQQAGVGAGGGTAGHADVAVELEMPASLVLPDGRVRLFKRKGDRLEMVSEDPLHVGPGVARMALAPDVDITGERRDVACTTDEQTRTIHEKIEIKVENKGKQAADVVVREYLWRWPMWRIDPTDESPRGVRAGAQTQEYRINVPAGGKKTVTYSVVYTW